mgnify:CR=1 FL=1
MERIEKLVNLIESKYGSVSINETTKAEIRKIISEEIARVTESLEEVNDSEHPMTFESLQKVLDK